MFELANRSVSDRGCWFARASVSTKKFCYGDRKDLFVKTSSIDSANFSGEIYFRDDTDEVPRLEPRLTSIYALSARSAAFLAEFSSSVSAG